MFSIRERRRIGGLPLCRALLSWRCRSVRTTGAQARARRWRWVLQSGLRYLLAARGLCRQAVLLLRREGGLPSIVLTFCPKFFDSLWSFLLSLYSLYCSFCLGWLRFVPAQWLRFAATRGVQWLRFVAADFARLPDRAAPR